MQTSVVILAAGKGTRMKSDLPKVLHPLLKRPLLAYSLDNAKRLGAELVVVVAGYKAELVKEAFPEGPGLNYALQEPQLGTGHAVMTALPRLTKANGPVLILYGDVPGLKAKTLEDLLQVHRRGGFDFTVLGFEPEDPAHYGRMIAGQGSELLRIVEYRDAGPEEREVGLVNSGICVAEADALREFLPKLKAENDQKEYYLTDLVELLRSAGKKAGYHVCPDPDEVEGVNSKEELIRMARRLQSN